MVLTDLQITHNITQYLIKIDFEEIDYLIFNLYEYLRYELYGVEPLYLVECEEELFRIPKHFKFVLKEVKHIMEKENK